MKFTNIRTIRMKKIIALIYQSYLNRKLYTPYVKALMTFIGGIIILLALLLGFIKVHYFNKLPDTDHGMVLLASGIIVCSLLFIFTKNFKRQDLEKFQFTPT